MEKNSRLTIIILGAVITVLAILVLYAFVVRPAINGYTIKAQNQGAVYMFNSIVSSVQQKGYVSLPLTNNQSIILVKYSPPKQTSQTISQSK